MELTQNLWERYGFTGNPYDTKALSLSKAAPLSVHKAYIPRAEAATTADLLTNFLRNPGGGRVVVEGESGVGKTTFVNYHRQRWEKGAKHKLISPALELEMQANWQERDLLINLLATLSSRLRLEMNEKAFLKEKLLREITALVGVHIEDSGGFNATLNIMGTGGGWGRTQASAIKVGEITNDLLRQYLRQLISFVKQLGFSGVIYHLDNFDKLGVREPDQLKVFFESARDVLQEPGVYFIFVGNTGMFQKVIVPLPRVRSIFFDTPVHLEPLSLAEVKEVMEKRYQLLAAPGKQLIKPVADEVVESLYLTFSGKIRYVMNAITSLISHLPDSYAKSLSLAQAKTMLQGIAHSEIKRLIQGAEEVMFLRAAEVGRFTNSELSTLSGKSKQLIQKYLKNWLNLNLVSQAEKVGRNRFYEVEPRFAILREHTK